MNKQRFAGIGFTVFFMYVAMITLPGGGHPEVGSSHHPSPVRAPVAISEPARATPTPVQGQQPAIQPVPQPVPTPANMSAVTSAPSTPSLSLYLLLGLWVISALISIVGLAFHPSRRRHGNGRFQPQPTLAKGRYL